jgi:hypothetical protein
MSNYKFWNTETNEEIATFISLSLQEILVFSLVYADGFEASVFVQLIFNANRHLIITSGGKADDIKIIDRNEFQQEKNRYLSQEGVVLNSESLLEKEEYLRFAGSRLQAIKFSVMNQNDYYSEVTFEFDLFHFTISCGIDELHFNLNEL